MRSFWPSSRRQTISQFAKRERARRQGVIDPPDTYVAGTVTRSYRLDGLLAGGPWTWWWDTTHTLGAHWFDAVNIHQWVVGGPRRLHVDRWIRDGMLSIVKDRMGLHIERLRASVLDRPVG